MPLNWKSIGESALGSTGSAVGSTLAGGLGSALIGGLDHSKSVQQKWHGGLQFNPDGTFTYRPDGSDRRMSPYDLDLTNLPSDFVQSIFYQQWQNAYNKRMWDVQNEYNSPAAQRERFSAAGINPILAMSNDASIGLNNSAASPGNGYSGSPSASLGASDQAARSAFGSSIASSAVAGMQMPSEISQRESATRVANADATLKETDALTRQIKNWQEIRSMITHSNLEDKEARLKELDAMLADATMQDRVSQEHSKAAHMYNETQFDVERMKSYQYKAYTDYYTSLMAQKEYKNWDSRFNAELASMYAQARYYGASAEAAAKQALLYVAQTHGVELSNEVFKEIKGDMIQGQKSMYKTYSTQLDYAKEQLTLARKRNDTYLIDFWTDQVGKIGSLVRDVGIGVGAFKGAVTTPTPPSFEQTETSYTDKSGNGTETHKTTSRTYH